MPNKTIYLDTVNYIEENIGYSFINREDVAERLQESWKNDRTPAKSDYLKVYNFKETRRISEAFNKMLGDNKIVDLLFSIFCKVTIFRQCVVGLSRFKLEM